MAAPNTSDSDMKVLTNYFMQTDNITSNVRQAFMRMKQKMESIEKNESKSNEGQSNENEASQSGVLTRDVILNSKWLFYNDNGFLGEMTFEDNGQITTYKNNNEASWKLSQGPYGHAMLEFYNIHNAKTCQFISAILDGNGKWRLQGPFQSNKSWRHYLHQI